MKNKYSSYIEWIIAIILIALCLYTLPLNYGSLSPLRAHQESEKGYNYGPSEIIKTIDLENTKLYLCRYKEWYSVSTVKKGFIKWTTAGEDIGNKIDETLPINYSWSYSHIRNNIGINNIFGYVPNSDIAAIQVESEDGKSIDKYDLDQSRTFLIYWIGENQIYKYKIIRGLDKNGKEIYSKDIF